MKNKFIYLIFASITLLSAFACITIFNDPDDIDGNGIFGGSGSGSMTIDALVENGNSSIVSVKAMCYGDDYLRGYEVATGKYENGRIKITLPATIPTQYLQSMEVEPGTTISDKNAMWNIIGINAYDKDDKNIGGFFYSTLPPVSFPIDYDEWNGYSHAWIVYVDRDVIIKGTTQEGDVIVIADGSLKKGWNLLYRTCYIEYKAGTIIETETDTTKKPSGKNFKWYFYG
jgi:hypothetical protein